MQVLTPLALAFLLALGVILVGVAIARRRIVTTLEGSRVQSSNELERILAPIGEWVIGRGGDRTPLTLKMRQARLRLFGVSITPELWTAILILGGPMGFMLGLGVVSLASMSVTSLTFGAVIGLIIGVVYPRMTLSRRLSRRRAAIHRDAQDFISLYARLFASHQDMNFVLGDMARMVAAEKTTYGNRAALPADVRRRIERARGTGPYESDLWEGLRMLVRAIGPGLVRADSSIEHPDALTYFASYVGDKDIAKFVEWLREAVTRDVAVTPERLDGFVESLREAQYQEVQRASIKLQQAATTIMVLFALPILLLGLFVPLFGGMLMGTGG